MTLKGEYKKYCEIYNDLCEKNNKEKVVLLYQLGKFYEIYEFEDGGNATYIANLLNIQLTRKDKKKSTENKNANPLMCGVPTASLEKYIDILYDNGFTVGIVNQVGEGKDVQRLPVVVSSAATNTDYIMKKNPS